VRIRQRTPIQAGSSYVSGSRRQIGRSRYRISGGTSPGPDIARQYRSTRGSRKYALRERSLSAWWTSGSAVTVVFPLARDHRGVTSCVTGARSRPPRAPAAVTHPRSGRKRHSEGVPVGALGGAVQHARVNDAIMLTAERRATLVNGATPPSASTRLPRSAISVDFLPGLREPMTPARVSRCSGPYRVGAENRIRAVRAAC